MFHIMFDSNQDKTYNRGTIVNVAILIDRRVYVLFMTRHRLTEVEQTKGMYVVSAFDGKEKMKRGRLV